jgi:hypothetical protein
MLKEATELYLENSPLPDVKQRFVTSLTIGIAHAQATTYHIFRNTSCARTGWFCER